MFSKGGGEALAKNCDVAFLGNIDLICIILTAFFIFVHMNKCHPAQIANAQITSKAKGGKGWWMGRRAELSASFSPFSCQFLTSHILQIAFSSVHPFSGYHPLSSSSTLFSFSFHPLLSQFPSPSLPVPTPFSHISHSLFSQFPFPSLPVPNPFSHISHSLYS